VVCLSIAKDDSAHEDTYFNANILHQDISVKDIVAVGDGHGLLIDWDMCKDLGNMSQTQEYHDAAQHRVSEYHYIHNESNSEKGTWKYMAARLLIKKYDQSAHNCEDDLESFYHVMNWMALHYTSHTMKSEDLTHNHQRIFEESYKAHDGTPMVQARFTLGRYNYLGCKLPESTTFQFTRKY
jgi:hypothetical protein